MNFPHSNSRNVRDQADPGSFSPPVLMLAMVFIIAFIGGTVAYSYFFPRTPTPFRIGMVRWIGNDVLILAQESGYFKDSAVQLVTYPSAEEVIRAFQDRTIDAASVTGDEVLRLLAHRQEPKVFLVLDYSNGADGIVARPPIQSVAELKNKRVAVEASAVGAYLLARALNLAGLKESDVTVVPELLVEHVRSYLEGKVDAVVAFEPDLSALTRLGAQTVFSSDKIPREIFDVLVTREQNLKEQTEAITTIRAAWQRAVRDIREQPVSSFERLAGYYRTDPEEFSRAMKKIEIPDVDQSHALLGGNSETLVQGLKRLSEVMKRFGLLITEIDPSGVVAP